MRKIVATFFVLALLVITIGVLVEGGKRKAEDKEEEEVQVIAPFLFRELLYGLHPIYSYVARGFLSVTPYQDYVADHSGVEEIREQYMALWGFDGETETWGNPKAELEAWGKRDAELEAWGNRYAEIAENGRTAEGPDTGAARENASGENSGEKEPSPAVWYELSDEAQAGFFLYAGSGFISATEFPDIFLFDKDTEKEKRFEQGELRDLEFVLENFYTVDAATSSSVIHDVDELLDTDCRVDKTAPGPHILIYHTHSQEGFADSVPGDSSTTIVGAGEKLADILRKDYGFSVFHHTGEYDVNSRDDAYAVAAPAVEAILAEYPQIQVVIDLHRDGVGEEVHLVKEMQGVNMAQFMFFNGLSYSNKKGELDYLPNANLIENLSLSLKLTVAANEYYPGLVRTNYLNAYRYNMHYRGKSLLIELGAQTNTVEEIQNSCYPLARVLNLVLSGEETY